MRTHRILAVLAPLALMLVASLPSHAQVSYSTATLRGTAVDPGGGVIPGATVTARSLATGIAKSAKTGADGTYQIPELSPGTYDVEVNASGFAKLVAKSVALTVGQVVVYDAHLQVGASSSVVEVSSAALPLIETERTQQANTIDQRQVADLPNINRTFTQPIYTAPGVANSNAPTIQDSNVGTGYLSSGFSIGGSTGRSNLVTIDGGENDYGSGALRVTHVPLDSIQEYQINRNAFAAEFGNTIGSAINMVTKGGTNNSHGIAYGYFRNEGTDSGSYFNKLLAPGTKPFEQGAIAGGAFGGPIKRDKLFFFMSYEHQQLDQTYFQDLAAQTEFQPLSAQTSTAHVTQLAYLTQLLSSGNPGLAGTAAFYMGLVPGMPQGGTFFSPLGDPARGIPADPALSALVAPNDGKFNGVISVIGAERGIPGFNIPRGRYNNLVSRLDYLPSSKDSLFLRFGYLNETDNVVPQPPTSTFDHFYDYTLTASWTRTLSASLVNIVRFQYVPQNTASNRTPTNLLGPCGLNTSTGALTGGCGPEYDIGNQIVLGNPFAFPYYADWHRFQFDDTLSWFKGAHSVKFGGTYRPDYYSVNEQLWLGGEWSFTDGAIPIIGVFPTALQPSLVAFNLGHGYPATGPTSTNLTGAQEFAFGLPIILLQASPTSNSRWKAWDHTLGLFAQDSWKMSPKLTLNYGVRVDYFHPPSPVPSSVYASPRLGIGWDPKGDGKTAIRAGGGLFVAPVLFLIPFYTNSLGNSGRYINQGGLSAAYPPDFPAPPLIPACSGIPSIFCAWGIQATHPNEALNPAELEFAGAGQLGCTAPCNAILNPFGPTGVGTVFFGLGHNFKPAYSIQASASIEREIGHNLSFELGYNMYNSVHVQLNLEKNYCNLSIPNLSDSCPATVPGFGTPIDPFVGPFYAANPFAVTTNAQGVSQPNLLIFQNNAYSSVGNGNYNGLTASLKKKYGNGLQFQANYTYSHAIDDTSDYSSLTTPFRSDLFRRDRSSSLFNVTHSFVFNAVYNTQFKPGESVLSTILADITIAPVVSAHSGIPFTLLVPGLGGANGNGSGGHISQARPYNEARNVAIGPTFATWDMLVSKAFYINRESGLRLDMIVQSTNLLNHTNFAAVNNNFPADPTFKLPNGGTLLDGPYRVRGFAPTSKAQLSTPLAFTKAYLGRQVSFGLRLAF
jgi:hypothetical protein